MSIRAFTSGLLLMVGINTYASYEPTTKDVSNMYDKSWSVTNLGLGVGTNHKIQNKTRMNLLFSHYSSWRYGYHDLKVNFINPANKDYVIASEYKPSLSLTRSNNTGLWSFPLLDIALAGHFGWNELNERNFGAGFELHLAPPAAGHYLIFGVYGIKNLNHPGGSYLLHARTKFTLMRGLMFKFSVDGYPNKQGAEIRENLRLEGSMMLDVGRAWSSRDKVYLSPTVTYWINKLGRNNINEVAFGVNLIFALS